MLHDWKYASKRSESFGFYCYICHACYGFLCLWIRNTKVSENADMAKTWATKCCSGTYKNNYQLCCGIKVIYPRSIRQVVSDIMMQPNANFGNKYEIMNLFTKGVQNGNDSMIVSSQINSAAYYGRKTPQSTYTISFNSLFRFRGFSHRRKFW